MTYTRPRIADSARRQQAIAARPCRHDWNDSYITTVCMKCHVDYVVACRRGDQS